MGYKGPTAHASKQNIALYWPNIIGYVRILLCIAAVGCFSKLPWTAAVLYGISQILDAIDGNVARALNQASIFGAVLDQVTDRMSTLCIYTLLASRYPSWTALILTFAITDLAGHWIYVHAQAIAGARNHKAVPTIYKMSLLRVYYENRYVMFICHACLEAFLCGLLILTHIPAKSKTAFQIKVILVVISPLFLLKAVTNALQIFMGAALLIDLENSRHKL